MKSLDSNVKLQMKYQKAGSPKYCMYSPQIESWKWTVKKKKFQTKFIPIEKRLKLLAIPWFSVISLTWLSIPKKANMTTIVAANE